MLRVADKVESSTEISSTDPSYLDVFIKYRRLQSLSQHVTALEGFSA